MDFRKTTETDDGRTVTMGHRRRTGSAPWWRLPLILVVLLGLLVLLVTQLRGDNLGGRNIQEHVGEPAGGSEGAPVQRSPLGGIVPGGEGPGPLTVPPAGTQTPAGQGGIPAPNGQGLQLPQPEGQQPGAQPTQPDMQPEGATPMPAEPAEPGVDSPGPAVPPPAAPPGTGQP